MTESYSCKCGELITVPSREAVSDVMRELEFDGEITLKRLCPGCGRRQSSSYSTSNGHKSVDNRNI
jgi:hypothetical protein